MIKEKLEQSLADGMTKQQFIKNLAPTLQESGWAPKGRGGTIPYRLGKIYAINRRTARASGQWQRIKSTMKLLPYLIYGNGSSKNHRVDHVQWKGVCLPANDSWWDTHYPPNGWGCKCHVRQVGRAEYKKLSKKKAITTTAPKVIKKDWVNKLTGEVVKVSQGIDPSWDYNVGSAAWEGVMQTAEQTVYKLLNFDKKKVWAKKWINNLVAGVGFKHFIENPPINKRDMAGMPLAVLPVDMVGTGGKVLIFKPSVADKQIKSRAGTKFGVEDYLMIQKILDYQPELLKKGDNRSVYVGQSGKDGKSYVLVFEVENNKNVLVSFYSLPSNKKERDREIRRLKK